MLCIVACVALIALDLWSKDWAEEALAEEPPNPPATVCEPDAEAIERAEEAVTRAEAILAEAGDEDRAAAAARLEGARTRVDLTRGYLPKQLRDTDPIVLVDGYFELRYAENCGAAFGLLRDAPPWVRKAIFGGAAILAVVALFWMFITGRGGPLFAASVPFIVSGAIGNLYDRVFFGYVVDFLRFHWETAWSYPTFNVADIAITIGVGLYLIDSLRDARAQSAESASSSEKPAEPSEA
jgi:signal peptidase II